MQGRCLAAGFLAGASGLVGLMVLLALLLLGFGVISLVREAAMNGEGGAGPLAVLGPALATTLGSLPGYVWSVRWPLLVLGALGALLALVDAAQVRFSRPWRDHLGLAVTLSVVAGTVTWALFAYREVLLSLLTDQPELFTEQRLLVVSNTTTLMLAALLALGLTYAVWTSWTYWYEKWTAWLQVPRPQPSEQGSASPTPPPREDDWRVYQARMAQLKRSTPLDELSALEPAATQPTAPGWSGRALAGLAAASVLMLLMLEAYDETGPDVRTGMIGVTPQVPTAATVIDVPRAPRRIVVSNTAGEGKVDVALTTAEDPAPIRRIQGMQLAGSATRFQKAELDLRDLEPGQYRLVTSLRGGRGGLLNYVILYGGGWQGTLSTLGLGLAAGLWTASATALLMEIFAGRGLPSTVRREI